MKRYVLGFMFNSNCSDVALIRKNSPDWQRGKLNGIGGKVDGSELSITAMCREFEEEAGMETFPSEWMHFLQVGGEDFGDGSDFSISVYFARHSSPFLGDWVKTKTDEPIVICSIREAIAEGMSGGAVDNLPWIILLALDSMKDGKPWMTISKY